jgi:phage tail sheath protein FI
VRFVPGAGIVVDSSRTLSTKTLWWYVGVRRLFNFVKTSLKNGLRWVRQEPNKKTLWDKVKFNSVRPFLLNLYRNGAFGEGTPDQVFTINCDANNNPPYLVDQGMFTLEVYFYPSKPAETVVIIVGQQDSGASAGEA